MARVAYVDEATAAESVGIAFERMREKRGKVTNIYRALAHKPAMLTTIGPFVAAVQAPDEIDARMKERIILRVSLLNNSLYCTHAHNQIMAKMGFSADEIAAVSDPSNATFDDPTRAALAFAEELTRSPGAVSEGTFATLRLHFSESQIVEITMLVALYNMVNRFNAGLELDVEEY
jgi:uncharacterized peroxidase-related enzyme